MSAIPLPLAVAAGGALGAVGRHYLATALARTTGSHFPFGTLSVNILGSFLMGVIVGMILARGPVDPSLRAFLTVGLMGGFTTFSAFSMETILLIERGNGPMALLYAALSVLFCVTAVAIGLWLTRP